MEWAVTTLGNVCEFENGDRGKNYPSRAKFVDSGIAFINAGHIDDGVIDFSKMNYISGETFSSLSRGKVQSGDVLFCLRGSLGKFGIVDKDTQGAIASSLVIIRPKNLSADFLAYYLRSSLCQKEVEKYAAGAAQPNLGAKDLSKFEISIPPIPEQKRIVAILDQAFADIEQARAKTEQNLKNARELFESYLQQEFSQRGEGWEEYSLGEICNFKHGFAFKSEFFTQDKGYELLTPGNFFEKGGYRDRGSKQKHYDGPFPIEFLMSKGDLLVAMTEQAAGLLGSSALVPKDNTFLHNQRLGLVELTDEFKGKMSMEILFHLFNTKYFRAKVQETATGLKVRHTSPKKMQVIPVCLPSDVDEQKKISERLFYLKEQTLELEEIYKKKALQLDELKKSILQKAFSGELTKASDNKSSKGAAA
jgi:type I restriction enzyme S subunit